MSRSCAPADAQGEAHHMPERKLDNRYAVPHKRTEEPAIHTRAVNGDGGDVHCHEAIGVGHAIVFADGVIEDDGDNPVVRRSARVRFNVRRAGLQRRIPANRPLSIFAAPPGRIARENQTVTGSSYPAPHAGLIRERPILPATDPGRLTRLRIRHGERRPHDRPGR
jgi:hypothetical protein